MAGFNSLRKKNGEYGTWFDNSMKILCLTKAHGKDEGGKVWINDNYGNNDEFQSEQEA